MESVTVLHWNVNEMRTSELVDRDNGRVKGICERILDMTEGKIPDLASFNELQYDLASGKNLRRLLERLASESSRHDDLSTVDTSSCFHPGNCGARAVKKDGEYLEDRHLTEEKKLQYGDSLNCLATVPGQYGIGLWSKFPVLDVFTVSRLKWLDFNPSVNLNVYADPQGNGIPSDITLFDKCCMVARVDCGRCILNVVLLHALPAYPFGNPRSFAVARNGDQLAFLEWLITGEAPFQSPESLLDDNGRKLVSLRKEEAVVVLGDLNCDFRKETPGSMSLNRISRFPGVRMFPRGASTAKVERDEKLSLQLDYILTRNVTVAHEKVGDPEKFSDHSPLLMEIAL